mmetsp:Transcript_48254/g.115775  ORF Transcript_48254/g.115775 Transcript_48254/m.115775 type:complete len:200 (-) Transcript_48254:104-703(-)
MYLLQQAALAACPRQEAPLPPHQFSASSPPPSRPSTMSCLAHSPRKVADNNSCRRTTPPSPQLPPSPPHLRRARATGENSALHFRAHRLQRTLRPRIRRSYLHDLSPSCWPSLQNFQSSPPCPWSRAVPTTAFSMPPSTWRTTRQPRAQSSPPPSPSHGSGRPSRRPPPTHRSHRFLRKWTFHVRRRRPENHPRRGQPP